MAGFYRPSFGPLDVGKNRFAFNTNALQSLTVGDTMTLPIERQVYQAAVERLQFHANGSQTWFATIEDGKAQ